jgi:tetratricopeptide (TPR) repeat protein
MIDGLFDPLKASILADTIVGALSKGGSDQRFLVEGAGCDAVIDFIAQRLEAAVVRVPPSNTADVPLHALLQAASGVPPALESALDPARTFDERVRAVFKDLANANRALIVHLPDGAADGDESSTGWFSTFLDGAIETNGLALTLANQGAILPRWRHVSFKTRTVLPAPHTDAASLKEPRHWGELADAAERLAKQVHSATSGPIELRLKVGLVALGMEPVHAAKLGSLPLLVAEYQRFFKAPDHRDLAVAVKRLLLARMAPPERLRGLFTHALTNGEDDVSVSPSVRSLFQGAVREVTADAQSMASVHLKLANHHRSLDGASQPREAAKTSPTTLVHWLEKVHHLAHAGPLGASEWNRQAVENREFLIDRARALSIEFKDYDSAAEVYSRCLALDSKDAYALHYRAFNLDRLGRNPNEVERCYRAALTANPENLYYHSRLVTFLIDRARYADALTAFQLALASVVGASQDLVFWHLTLHVVRAWLAVGEVGYAREALNTVHRTWELEAEFERIEQRVGDAEEAERLGIAVYPPGVPISQRWRAPRLAQRVHQQRDLVDWFPGRVARADVADELVATWVERGGSPSDARVLTSTYTVDEWRQLGGQVPSDKALYIEFADYGDDVWVVFTDPRTVTDEGDSDTAERLRYLLAEPHADSVVG